jgi:hypothetical protein
MHRSRLSTVLIDAPSHEAAASTEFWAAALGVETTSDPDEPQFIGLVGALPGLTLAVQAVHDQARFHVDFETDDLDAETARLIGLGAVEVNRWLDCRILQAPGGGHLLCVIPRHSDDEVFERTAHTWE